MKPTLLLAATLALAAASAPALACESDASCENRPGDGRRGEDRTEPPRAPDVKGQKKEQVAPLSVPAPDAKAPAQPAAPGTKTACDSDDGCANNR